MTGLSENGDNSARQVDWPAALASHQRWLRTVAYSRLHDRESVDEVMQEVALAAVRQAAPLRDAAKAAPWLYRLVVRQALLYRRRCGRQRKLVNGYAFNQRPAASTRTPLEWLLADERRRQVQRALKRLPKRDTDILLLKYTENWTYREIALHLGVSESAVEARLHRARKRLRVELATLETSGTTK